MREPRGDVVVRATYLRFIGEVEMHAADFSLMDQRMRCLLYTSDAADERSSVDLGGRRIIKKKTKTNNVGCCTITKNK